jgi:hypothetical protein
MSDIREAVQPSGIVNCAPPLAIHDALTTSQRPKLELFDRSSFVGFNRRCIL